MPDENTLLQTALKASSRALQGPVQRAQSDFIARRVTVNIVPSISQYLSADRPDVRAQTALNILRDYVIYQ